MNNVKNSITPASANKNLNSRFELKYKLDYIQYYKIKSAIKPYMKIDSHTAHAPESMYFVRSLYYDTYDYNCYSEKISGNCDRIKFRIRTYDGFINNNTVIKAEIKVRKANLMEKYSVFVPYEDYALFLKNRHWFSEDDPVLIEFERYIHLKALSPKIIVEYNREGFVSRNGDNLRITMDHRVRSADAGTLFPEKPFFRVHHPHMVILEIKYSGIQPQWIMDIVKNHGLKISANSKFAQGIQVGRKDLYNPSGIVIVR